MTTSSTAPQILDQVRRLIDMAQHVDTGGYEDEKPDAIGRELLPRIYALLNEEKAALVVVFDLYETSSAEAPAGTLSKLKDSKFDVRVDRLLDAEQSPRRIADIALIARMESSRLRNRIEALSPDASSWEYVELCAKARRQVLKSATAIDRAICELEGLPPRDTWYATELQISLKVRRVYTAFRHSLRRHAPKDDGDLTATLRLVGTSLAVIVGRPVYEVLRITDRMAIRTLQKRIIGWLRHKSRHPENPQRTRAARLWSDINSFADLLTQVNNRSELMEHDLTRLRLTLQAISVAGDEGLSASTLRELINPLFGLDDQLDAFIDSHLHLDEHEIGAIVQRLTLEVAPTAVDMTQ